MGLLSGFVGDETTKDEYGLTQADRRQPLFSGLLQAGMLGLAAGDNISSGQRAQLLGQMGGAIAGIPEAMQKQVSEAAQMQLRRQQFQAGQQKLDQQRKVQAYAQTPEFAEMMKGLTPAQQFTAKIMIESGDADGLQRLMTGIDAHNRDRIPSGYEKDPATGGLRPIPGGPHDKSKEGMAGTGERQQMRTWLMTEDPSSQRYAAAYDYFTKEQRFNEGGVWTTMPAEDLEQQGYPKPSWAGRPGGTRGGTWPPAGAPPAGQEVTNPDTGLITETSADGKTVTETDPKTGIKTVKREGQPAQTVKPKPSSDTDISNFHKFEADAATLLKALEDYQTETTRMSDKDKVKSLLDVPTAASMASGLAQMLSKGEVLLNLGVLTGDDLARIRSILPDPTTFRGSAGDYALAVKKVSDLIKFKTQFREKQIFPYGRPGRPSSSTAPPGGGGGGGGAQLPRKNEKGEYVVD